MKNKLYKEISTFIQNNVSLDDYFVCIYGSYVTSHFGKHSDLDILFATKSYNKKAFEKIRDFVIHLHTKNNLKVDEEVPYKNKLLVSYDDIKSAINLEPFLKRGIKSKYIVPLIKSDVGFLKSKEVRLRLVLNILTSPHIFVCGSKSKYETFRKKSEQSIVKLARGLTEKNRPSNNDILHALLIGQRGKNGQAYLGYKTDRKEVVAYLKELVKRNTK